LAIDTIKIDKTFVMSLETNHVNLAIIKATQVIGDALNCDLVAEGIETIAQLHMLRETGINSGQGFLFSKAISEDEFVKLCGTELSIGTSLAFVSRNG
jgi:sensor c-di-GMP phosphodiesterase-like protein